MPPFRIHIQIIYTIIYIIIYIYVYIYIFIASVRALHGQTMPEHFYSPSIHGRMECEFLNICEGGRSQVVPLRPDSLDEA